MSLNRIIIVGNVGKTPQIVNVNGSKVANLSVATSYKYKDRNGVSQVSTEWHSVSVFGKAADFVEQYVTTGCQVLVEGSIHYNSTDKGVYANIRAEKIEIVSRPKPKEEAVDNDDIPW